MLAFGLMLAAPAAARDLDIDITTEEGQVKTALSALGFAVVPQAFNSLLFYEVGQDNDLVFSNGQLGGGFNPIAGSRLFVEGIVSFQRYAPEYAIDGAEDDDVDVRWRSFAGTAGVGYDFPVAPNLVFRPIANVAAGRITSNADVDFEDGETRDFIAGDGVTAGGFGGSLALVYKTRTPAEDVDLRARYSRMLLQPLGDRSDVDVDADVETLAFLGRVRRPIPGLKLGGRQVRQVFEATYAAYLGDQGDVLEIPWLVRIGTGFELDLNTTERFRPRRVRMMLRYVRGESSGGLSLGAGLVF